jgi:hypothetical protein
MKNAENISSDSMININNIQSLIAYMGTIIWQLRYLHLIRLVELVKLKAIKNIDSSRRKSR